MEDTKIEWAHHTFNPWIGCTKVSPACDHCYAERVAKRMQVEWGSGQPRKRTRDHYWREPLKWDRRAATTGNRERVFCASLADVFDREVSDAWRTDLFMLIQQTPNLDWLLLTKRPGPARRWMRAWTGARGGVVPNIWLGITVVTQEEADRDVPKLLDTPAAVRFLSCEPLLGPVDLRAAGSRGPEDGDPVAFSALSGCDATDPPIPGIDWVIAGGESGPGARPMHPDWVRSLRDQCADAGVPFFFKQWGEWSPYFAGHPPSAASIGRVVHDGITEKADGGFCKMWPVGKKAAGRTLDGRTHGEVPG